MPFWNQGRDGATAVFWQAHALPPDHPDVLAEFQTGNAPRDGPNPTAPPHHLQALRIAFPRLLGFACTYRSHPPSKSGHNAEIAPQVTQAQIVKRTTWGLHRAYTGPTPGRHHLSERNAADGGPGGCIRSATTATCYAISQRRSDSAVITESYPLCLSDAPQWRVHCGQLLFCRRTCARFRI